MPGVIEKSVISKSVIEKSVVTLSERGVTASGTVFFTVKGRVNGNASFADFSNGNTIDNQLPTYDLIIEVEAGGDVNLTYTSQNDFDTFSIDSGTVGSFNVDATNFQLTNVQSNIECTIVRID